MNNNYKWDLSQIYKTDNMWKKDLKLFKEKNELFQKYKGKVLKNSKTLYEVLLKNVELDMILDKLISYAFRKYDADSLSEENIKRKNLILNEYTKYNQQNIWFSIEIKKLDSKQFKEFCLEEENLKKYEYFFKNILKGKKHLLKPEEEEFLSKIEECLNNSSEIFNMLDNTDVKFEDIKIGRKKYPLNHSTYSEYISSDNRKIREKALENMLKYYKEHINTISSIYIKKVKSTNVMAKIQNFENNLEKTLYYDDIDKKVYSNLIEVVNQNLELLQQSLKLKRKYLKLDKLNYYDLFAKEKQSNEKVSIENCKKIILEALNIFGNDYLKIINQAFDNNWIDFEYRNGKKSGGYCANIYNVHPYILMNYSNNIDSVYTLIHELGHASHDVLCNKNQDYIYSDAAIFLAEIASITNEIILSDYLLKIAKTKEEKRIILNKILNDFRTTVFRQTLFAEFEEQIMLKYENDQILSQKIITDIFDNLNKKYYGDSVVLTEDLKYEWARIPHFYTPFYVYQYATGKCIALAIAKNILDGKLNAIEDYFKILSSGSKDSPLKILKSSGYDLNNNEIFESAMQMYKNYIEEFEKLLK